MSRSTCFAAAFALVFSLLLALGTTQSTKPSLLYTRSDIQGGDISCNQVDYNTKQVLPYCQITSGITSAEDACRSNENCTALSSDGYTFFLKSASSPRIYREGWVVLVTNVSLNGCQRLP